MIGWNPAPSDWVTLSIIRDHLGRPIATFSANLGTCTIMLAELRAAEMGFRIAWDLGLRKVQLQMDSLAAAAAINGETIVNLRHERTLHSIEELRRRNCVTSVSHIYKEGNCVADLLAHHGHSLDFGIHTDCIYPVEVRSAIWNDSYEILFLRSD
ncbi:Putative ribonuclease H protein At1g65750 [Linum perenne]